MGVKYLWDTNTAIYYMQRQFTATAEKFVDNLLVDEKPCISAITEIELLCWKTIDEKELATLHNFIEDASVIELEQPIKFKTADIRKQHKIKLPDAIIAATAIVYDLTLITRNVGDFKNIQSLQIVDLYTM